MTSRTLIPPHTLESSITLVDYCRALNQAVFQLINMFNQPGLKIPTGINRHQIGTSVWIKRTITCQIVLRNGKI